jgi:hypothetical protein
MVRERGQRARRRDPPDFAGRIGHRPDSTNQRSPHFPPSSARSPRGRRAVFDAHSGRLHANDRGARLGRAGEARWRQLYRGRRARRRRRQHCRAGSQLIEPRGVGFRSTVPVCRAKRIWDSLSPLPDDGSRAERTGTTASWAPTSSGVHAPRHSSVSSDERHHHAELAGRQRRLTGQSPGPAAGQLQWNHNIPHYDATAVYREFGNGFRGGQRVRAAGGLPRQYAQPAGRSAKGFFSLVRPFVSIDSQVR